MREIKFRAWDQKTKTMFYDVQNLYDGMGVRPEEPDQPIYDADIGTQSFGDVLAAKCPVMQYTGLEDKNGKEIYEGDVVREHPNCVCDYIVGFDRGHFTLKHTQSNYNKLGIWNVDHNLEVIGNIWENPELLTG